MALNADDPTIPVGCDDYTLPKDVGSDDCFLPTLLYGPGTNLVMSLSPFPAKATGATSNDITTVEYTTKEAADDPDALSKRIVCQLSLNPGTPASDRINGLDYPKPADLSLAVTLQDLSDPNYALMRRTQKGGLRAYFWFMDRNGYFYGGRNGIFGGPALLALRLNLPTDENALQTITGTITHRGFFDPARQLAPVPYL